MGQYVARKRARFYSGGRQVNIPWGAVLDEQDGSLYWQGRPLCRISSQNAYDYFSRNDDGNGKLRGQLVGSGMGIPAVPALQAARARGLVGVELCFL